MNLTESLCILMAKTK